MKFTAIAAVAASAALVSASPLRVVVVSSTVQGTEVWGSNGSHRFGLPAAPGAGAAWPGKNINNQPVAQIMSLPPNGNNRRPCSGRFRQKAIDFSNSFRKAFGFPPIESPDNLSQDKTIHGGVIRIMTPGGNPTKVNIEGVLPAGNGWFGKTNGGEKIHVVQMPPPPPVPHRYIMDSRPVGYAHGSHYGHHHGMGFNHRDQPFLVRVQNAILTLGPWEGRAVAFVLGCGLGVLLRMIWVLGVVLYRSFNDSDSDEHNGYVQVTVFDADSDDENRARRTPFSAPPAYVYPVDEKIAVEEAPKVVDVAPPAAPAPVVKAQNTEEN